jgi:hypothetical protein
MLQENMEKKRKPQILPQFTFNNDFSIIEKYELDEITGQGSIVFSVLQHTPMPTDSRIISEGVSNHPEFKTRMTFKSSGQITPASRVTNYWLSYFRKLGLLIYIDVEEQKKAEARSNGRTKSYFRHRKFTY